MGSLATLELNPATKPFADYMYNSRRTGSLPESGHDSDGDFVSDLDELNGFGDPNDANVGLDEFECPGAEYGCVRVAKQKPEGDALLRLSSLLVAFGLVRRRRR